VLPSSAAGTVLCGRDAAAAAAAAARLRLRFFGRAFAAGTFFVAASFSRCCYSNWNGIDTVVMKNDEAEGE